MSVVTALGKKHLQEALAAVQPVRTLLLKSNAHVNPHEIERAFCAIADVGEWNRTHPHDRIEAA